MRLEKLFSSFELQNGNSGLISVGSSDLKSVRLNTHTDSIEPGKVHREPRLAFQFTDPTPVNGPETLFSQPKGYPFKIDGGCPMKGHQFFADVPLGRMLQNIFRSEVMSSSAG